MPFNAIKFTGGIDTDSPNENIQPGWVRAAYDLIWRGPAGNRRPEANYGTTLVPNALLPVGSGVTNMTIGAKYDQVYKRIFFFNWNSAGHHGIYVYNTAAQPIGQFQTLIQTGVNTVGDPLAFTAKGWISSIDILYADNPIGPILFYVDSLGRPTQININRYLAGVYPAIQRSFIDVIKAPPIMAPQVTYENDFTVQANGLVNSLWQFASAWFTDNNEKTVISTASKLVLPTAPFDPTQNYPTSQCARFGIYVQTGDATVKTIRIYGRSTANGATTDWMILADIKKSDYNLTDNGIYKFLFYNTGSYVTEDPTFAVLGFDVVPLKAGAQVLLDGTTPAYGNITEGYDYLNPSINQAAGNQGIPRYTINGSLFFAALNGQFTGSQPQVQIFLTGAGTNDGNGNPTTLVNPVRQISVSAKSSGTDISFVYINTSSNVIATILAGLQAAAIAAGWTFVTSDSNSITLYYPTGTILFESSYVLDETAVAQPYQFPQLAFYPQCAYQTALVYFDGAGRTNGALSNITFQFTTPQYAGSGSLVNSLRMNPSSVPPAWAVYWRPVRTDNLTFGRYLDWVSDSAYSGPGQLSETEYGYFGVTNIFAYNTSIGATQGVISYGATSFTPGDRIRVLGIYAVNGTFTQLNLDYAILGVSVNPVVSGVVKQGTYIQINYPTNDISANFKLDGTSNFQNYKILIYNYKLQNASSQNVFWEIGETFGIGNPGTPQAYHIGNLEDNVVDISDGDIYFRSRTIPIQNEYYIPTGGFDQTSTYGTLWINPGGNATPIVDNGIWRIIGGVQKVAGLSDTQYPLYGDNDMLILNESALPFSVRLRGEPSVVDKTDPNGQFAMYVKIVLPGNVVTTTQILTLQTGLVPGATNTFVIDATVVLPPGGKLWMINYCVNEMLIGGFQLTLDVIRSITLNVFDSSYSDIYALRVNSDNRPTVIDATALQTTYPTLFRWAEPYVPGTNTYLANRFFDVNKDEFDASHGAIMRMVQWQRRLRIGQERKWGEVGVYSKFIKNNTGAVDLIVNDQIIEQNNIQYFDGNFGLGNQTEIAVNDYQLWFYDPVRGAFCRLSLDGLKNISEEFMVQTLAGSFTPGYLLPYVYAGVGASRVVMCYNYVKDRFAETLFGFQGGTLAGQPNLAGKTIVFCEKTNMFAGQWQFAPDAFVNAENQLYSFSGGNLYIHNNTSENRLYYAAPLVSQLDLIFNDQEVIKKTFQALSYQPFANKIWIAKTLGDINTSFYNPQTTLQQISALTLGDFEIAEGQANAALQRDANSLANQQLALVNGDYLKGYWIRVLLTAPDNGFNAIFNPRIDWDISTKAP